MAVARMTAPNVTTAKRFTRRPASGLGEKLLDDFLRRPVRALADVRVAHDPLPVDDDRGGPRPIRVAAPDGEVVVLDDGIADRQLARGGRHPLVRLLPPELRRMHADDREALLFVPRVPVPQL